MQNIFAVVIVCGCGTWSLNKEQTEGIWKQRANGVSGANKCKEKGVAQHSLRNYKLHR